MLPCLLLQLTSAEFLQFHLKWYFWKICDIWFSQWVKNYRCQLTVCPNQQKPTKLGLNNCSRPTLMLYRCFLSISSSISSSHLLILTALSLSGPGGGSIYLQRQVHPWSNCQFIAGPHVSFCGFTTLLKGISAMLWRCSCTFPYYQNTFPIFCPLWGLNQNPSASQPSP